MNEVYKYFNEVYPKQWREAWELGKMAYEKGISKDKNPLYLKPFRSAWDQGWEGTSISGIFREMEKAVDKLPTRPI